MIEWNVLNGYEISFEKNESYRVRTVCKENALKKGEKREEGDKIREVFEGIFIFQEHNLNLFFYRGKNRNSPKLQGG